MATSLYLAISVLAVFGSVAYSSFPYGMSFVRKHIDAIGDIFYPWMIYRVSCKVQISNCLSRALETLSRYLIRQVISISRNKNNITDRQ